MAGRRGGVKKTDVPEPAALVEEMAATNQIDYDMGLIGKVGKNTQPMMTLIDDYRPKGGFAKFRTNDPAVRAKLLARGLKEQKSERKKPTESRKDSQSKRRQTLDKPGLSKLF